jgi:DNA-binding response OmpR family regulator
MSRNRVLIADSDDALLAAYRDHLRKEDFTVSTARSGLDCLESLADGTPDILVIDSNVLSELSDGVLAVLSEGDDLPWTRLIVLSNGEGPSARARLAPVPVNAWLMKPLSASALAYNIRRVLSLPAMNDRFVTEWA